MKFEDETDDKKASDDRWAANGKSMCHSFYCGGFPECSGGNTRIIVVRKR